MLASPRGLAIQALPRLAVFLFLLSGAWQASHAAELSVRVTGLENDSGKVAIAVYSGADGFPKEHAKSHYTAMLAIDDNSNSATTVFPGLPAGEYAVAAFHDYDNSGKLETNFFGVPAKAYGFSNNVRPRMRAPSFDEARFMLPETGARITIELAK